MEKINKSKLQAIAKQPKRNLHQRCEELRKNKEFYNISTKIALDILKYMKEHNLNYSDIGKILNQSEDIVKKMTSGSYNFDLLTLVKLKEVLNIDF